MSAPQATREGTAENFDTLVMQNSHKGLVLVDFWAPWVGPSLRQRGILEDLAQSFGGRFLLVSINTDQQKPLAERFGVRSLPSMKLFRDGRIVGEYHGVQPVADYPRIIEAHISRPPDAISAEAIRLWQTGNGEQALQRLAEAAIEHPQNLTIPALMAKILMRSGREADAHELLSSLPEEAQNAPEISALLAHLGFILTAREAEDRAVLEHRLAADPQNAECQYQLAAVLLTQDEIQPALDLLLNLSRQQPNFRHGIARKGMQAVLSLMDPQDEQTIRYRRELFRLNY